MDSTLSRSFQALRADEVLLRAALWAERVLGTAVERMGRPPAVPA